MLRALGALALERQARQGSAASSSAAIDITAYLHATTFAATGVRLVRSALPLENPAARIAWEQISLPAHLMRQRADLVHGLVNVLPLTAPCQGVVTVHDLAFVRTPEMLPPFKRAYLTALCRASTARAARIIAVSHQTAADLQRYFGTPAHRITVVHNGVSPRFTPRNAEATQAFRRRKHLPERYLLYLGTLEPQESGAALACVCAVAGCLCAGGAYSEAGAGGRTGLVLYGNFSYGGDAGADGAGDLSWLHSW
ncbi:MAG: glycosyltransferase [Anaerolineales bacterium]|nr:glycosyltransferase [Anaerolineales bacterium]